MNYQDFVANVAVRSDIGFDEADAATDAFFEALGDRLPATELRSLAEQLPTELSGYLTQGQMIDLKLAAMGFFEQIGQAEGTTTKRAKQHAKAIWEVLRQAITPNEAEAVLAYLPTDVRTKLRK